MSEQTKTIEKNDDGFAVELWLYLGNFKTSDNKIGVRFQLIGEDGKPTGEKMEFASKKRIARAVGGLYDVEVKREGDDVTARVSGGSFRGFINDANLRVELEMKQKIFLQQERDRALEKKYSNGFALPESWREMVSVYKKLNMTERRTFENLVIAKMRSDSDVF